MDNERKAIFLDIDGVLNCSFTKDRIWREENAKAYVGIEDKKVSLLAKMIESTGAEIVISSSWRKEKEENVFEQYKIWDDTILEEEYEHEIAQKRSVYDYLTDRLSRFSLKIYNDTPQIGDFYRGREISSFLSDHSDVIKYAVLDDERYPDFDLLRTGSVFYTDRDIGLTEDIAYRVVMWLNRKEPENFLIRG